MHVSKLNERILYSTNAFIYIYLLITYDFCDTYTSTQHIYTYFSYRNIFKYITNCTIHVIEHNIYIIKFHIITSTNSKNIKTTVYMFITKDPSHEMSPDLVCLKLIQKMK